MKKILLVGNPNVGKSTVFNKLTGENQHTGNWIGKTVDLAKGYFKYKDEEYEIYDLPGTYSLNTHSKEEEVTRDAIYYEDRKGTHNRFCFDQIYMRNAYKAGWKMEDSSFLGTYHSHAQLPAKLSDIDRDSLIKYFGMGRIMLVYSPKYNRMVAEYVDVDKKTHKVKIITKK